MFVMIKVHNSFWTNVSDCSVWAHVNIRTVQKTLKWIKCFSVLVPGRRALHVLDVPARLSQMIGPLEAQSFVSGVQEPGRIYRNKNTASDGDAENLMSSPGPGHLLPECC